MTWLERIRNWDYSLDGVVEWVLNLMEFHIQRAGIWGYIGIVLFIIGLGLAFPATRGVTSLVVSGVFRMVFTFVQNVLTLLTADLFKFFGKLLLAMFHRSRRWIIALAGRTRRD
jgi:membrane-bound ClpP family serine protease